MNEEADSKARHSEWDLGEPEVSWGSAGANLLAIVNGRVAGILFFEVSEQDRGWWLVMADSPDEQHHIDAPDVTEGASSQEAEEALNAALTMATLAVKDRLGTGGS